MQSYQCELVSKYAALPHRDDVEAADELDAIRKAVGNKGKKGDDRYPTWTWQTYLYHDGDHIALPMENLMSCLRSAGAMIKIDGNKTLKALSQTALVISEPFWEFLGPNGKKVPMAPIHAMKERPFSQQSQEVKKLGFDLFVKRAKVNTSKHVRVRARFKAWSARGVIHVMDDEQITGKVLQDLFDAAGKYIGLLDWRPSSPKSPGPYGTFKATVKRCS